MSRVKISKECLLYIIQHHGECNSILCRTVYCVQCELFKSEKNFKTKDTDDDYSYQRALKIFIKRYGEENLFDEVL